MVNHFTEQLTITIRSSENGGRTLFSKDFPGSTKVLDSVSIDWGRDSIFDDAAKRRLRLRFIPDRELPTDPGRYLYARVKVTLATRLLFDGTVDGMDYGLHESDGEFLEMMTVTATESPTFIPRLMEESWIDMGTRYPVGFYKIYGDHSQLPYRWSTASTNYPVRADVADDGFASTVFEAFGAFTSPFPNAHPIWEPGFHGCGPSVWSEQSLSRQEPTEIDCSAASIDGLSARTESVPMSVRFVFNRRPSGRYSGSRTYRMPARDGLNQESNPWDEAFVKYFHRQIETIFPMITKFEDHVYKDAFKLITNQQTLPLDVTLTQVDGETSLPQKALHTWENKDQLFNFIGVARKYSGTYLAQILNDWLFVPIGGRLTLTTKRVTHEMKMMYGIRRRDHSSG
ncbi:MULTISPECIES: hypothetical protein [Corynebacterium]|uniref:Uncharacterized protein n=1 Tax=Corynebacterium hadale TaxID=2026255 RepID=A0A269PFN0_9CORY|nr:hypothetical protein [Corynebacterium hadale]PAJ70916.1 hypothetical protein CIG21_01670 [Corynebacterium hadale]WKC60825.1 hypothetical protein CHAD_09860 [Corynebacterium hadale]